MLVLTSLLTSVDCKLRHRLGRERQKGVATTSPRRTMRTSPRRVNARLRISFSAALACGHTPMAAWAPGRLRSVESGRRLRERTREPKEPREPGQFSESRKHVTSDAASALMRRAAAAVKE
ncbi:unnamed protein product [Symbiodinium necroappetens]|uniref:Uncharacterized protein n=1 Tax=Symbiodinium necroappetens TaxID=1628268 RepID=A0A812KVH5_9DINO|nr:unnamed protein product [Symbiodinium necroappetens]